MNNTKTADYLLAVTIGPIQGFIAAARKTRDLWAGSKILSDLSLAAACFLRDNHALLIFPGMNDGKCPTSAANVILVQLEGITPDRVAELADGTRDALFARWRDFCDTAWRKICQTGNESRLRADLWKEQTRAEDVIEFYAAWVPVIHPTDYTKARNRVMEILAGRKNCRDFLPSRLLREGWGVPKSSLDGARESVLKEELVQNVEHEANRSALLLKRGEQLDAVGLVKRLGIQNMEIPSYPSLLEIAIRPLLKRFDIPSETADHLDELNDFADSIRFGSKGRELIRVVNEEGLYLAVLHADGDKMGAALSRLKSAEEHRLFSTALSRFSDGVPEIVHHHDGICVYAGGDDVLAFLPLHTCLDCAEHLRNHFCEKMKEYAETSISVGLAIGHYHEMLEDLLTFARQAERTAKTVTPGYRNDTPRFGDRNGLAIEHYTRGNIAVSVREQWDVPDGEKSLVCRLNEWSEFFASGLIPAKYPYDVQDIIQSGVYDVSKWRDKKLFLEALKADIVRLTRKKPEIGSVPLGALLESIGQMDSLESLKRFFNELYIARTVGSYRAFIGATQKKGDLS